MEWQFHERRPGMVRHNSHESEFFDADEIGRSDALVRETLQNSLDARSDRDDGMAHVQFRLLKSGRTKFDQYVRDLRPRLTACGLWHDDAGLDGTGALVIEDYGTAGLTGSVADDATGNFAYFWRCIGESGKSGSEGGRWGVGKRVFTDASNLCAVFGYTVREDDGRRMLMGQAVLKNHTLESSNYVPHGFFANFDEDGLQLPSESNDDISAFKNVFGLERKNEPGLSLVIPCPDAAITERGLIEATVFNYFYPILTNHLFVEINDIEIGARTIDRIIDGIDPQRIRKVFRIDDVTRLFNFIRDAQKLRNEYPDGFLTANSLRGPLTKNSFDAAQLEMLNRRYMDEELIAVRIPVQIKKQDEDKEQSTNFDVFLRMEPEGASGNDIYVRGNLTLPEERWLQNTGATGMLVANESLISEFLGDAEKPSHKKWTESKEDWKRTYEGAVQLLRAIRKAVRDLARLLDVPEERVDRDALREFFSKPGFSEKPKKRKKRRSPEPPSPLPPRHPQVVESYKVEGGFCVRAAKTAQLADFPRIINIKVAYDRSKGNPFLHYREFDFRLHMAPIAIEEDGAKITRKRPNSLLLTAESPEFKVTVTGFDPERDLRVQVS